MTGEVVTCSHCPATFVRRRDRKGTRCKACTARANSRAATSRAKRGATMRAIWADPDSRAARVETMTIANREPGKVANLREVGKRLNNVARFAHPLPAGHPARVAAGRTRTEQRLGWCPPSYRDDYRALVDKRGFTAAEARGVIESQIGADLKALRLGTIPPGRMMLVRAVMRWMRDRGAGQ